MNSHKICEILKKSGPWVLNQLYPPYCLVCKNLLSSQQAVCSTCAHEIELLSVLERCALCFSPLTNCHSRCHYCQQYPPHHRIFGQACCLQESHVNNVLIKHLETHVHWHLEAAMASLAFVQHDTLRWPKPDLILLEPSHWLLPNRRAYALSKRIVHQLATLFNVPYTTTHLDPTSLISPELPLEEQFWHDRGEASFSTKKPMHGMNILTFSLIVRKGTTWKALQQAIEPHGLARIWNLGLISGTGSWMD